MVKVATAELVKKEKGIILVDFYADWCGPCRMLGPIIEELAEEIPEINFLKVNIDDEREFAIANQVGSIPTIVIFKDGNEQARRVGFASKPELKKWINNYL
ncbi:MAG: thioredoxin [Bacilli bacterium]|nr:thioredoxin [Bacilli bacterium]MDD4388090.1 thioredoxin [Bacilli bacterium]